MGICGHPDVVAVHCMDGSNSHSHARRKGRGHGYLAAFLGRVLLDLGFGLCVLIFPPSSACFVRGFPLDVLPRQQLALTRRPVSR